MKKAPNWKPGEAVNGKWKQELLVFLGKEFKLNTLIETGTCDGGTLYPISRHFARCFSIELSEHYYNLSKEKFKDVLNVDLFHGDSSVVLREVLKMKPGRFLFWLDAHPSGGLTANEGDPLPEEIRAIIELSPDSLIVIDDQQDCDLGHVVEAGVNLNGYKAEYKSGIVFLYKEGLYNIPEFD